MRADLILCYKMLLAILIFVQWIFLKFDQQA